MSVNQDMLRRLNDERLRAFGEQRALLEEIEKREDKRPPAEERQTIERMDSAIDELKSQIDYYIERERREVENNEFRSEIEQILRPRPEVRQEHASEDARIEAFFRGAPGSPRSIDVDIRPAAAARSHFRSGARGKEFRDLLVGSAGGGASLVPTSFYNQLYDFLEVYSGVRKTNVRVVTTTSGENIDFPKVTAHGTAAIVGESTAMAEADPAFGKTTIGAYKYGQIIQLSNEMLADTGVPILPFVAEDAGRALARVTDTAYLTGSGTNAPQGALVAMGTAGTIQTTATGVPSLANLIDTVYSINDQYRSQGAQWLMRDATAGTIRKLAATTGELLWQPNVQAGQPDVLLGYPVITDPNMGAIGTAANTPIAFGWWGGYTIRDAGAIRFERSDEFAFTSDLVTFRSIMRTSGALVDLSGALKKLLEPTT